MSHFEKQCNRIFSLACMIDIYTCGVKSRYVGYGVYAPAILAWNFSRYAAKCVGCPKTYISGELAAIENVLQDMVNRPNSYTYNILLYSQKVFDDLFVHYTTWEHEGWLSRRGNPIENQVLMRCIKKRLRDLRKDGFTLNFLIGEENEASDEAHRLALEGSQNKWDSQYDLIWQDIKDPDVREMTYVYTDGSSYGGVWSGCSLWYGKDDSRNFSCRSSVPLKGNVGELMAVKLALQQFIDNGAQYDTDYTLVVGTRYAYNCIDLCVNVWSQNGWQNSKGEPLAHASIFKSIWKLYRELEMLDVELVWTYKPEDDADRAGMRKADYNAKDAALNGESYPSIDFC